ncbi:EamA family transporter RarD [Castellaniella sp.]|uniref:EamA family transporter RarD n=1 Tax=Castellaniella sp. TaxID=1955812 RepID=UPI002AFDE3E4|nr:EamA family transporter RarD [Castellaniella sp.]
MKRGIILSVASSALFAGMYFYATLMQPFDGDIVFAWRVLMGLPMMALVVHRARGWTALRTTAQRFTRGRFLAAMVLCSALLGVQLWLFVWAPLHGYALDVSMGYFLLPLVMVLAGRLVYREQLSSWQAWAVGFALLGVGHEWWRLGTVSWATALVALGYPPYFMLRRRLQVDALSSLWFDMLFLLPAAIPPFLFFSHPSPSPHPPPPPIPPLPPPLPRPPPPPGPSPPPPPPPSPLPPHPPPQPSPPAPTPSSLPTPIPPPP